VTPNRGMGPMRRFLSNYFDHLFSADDDERCKGKGKDKCIYIARFL